MQTARIVQAVALMLIVAVAASCSASKEYTSKLFAPRTPVPVVKDSQATALRFLELEPTETDQANWVTTDIIMDRDTSNRTAALDNFATAFPAAPVTKDQDMKSGQAIATTTRKPDTASSVPIVKNTDKKTIAPKTVPAETKPELKPEVVESEPVARYLNTGEVREKRSRND